MKKFYLALIFLLPAMLIHAQINERTMISGTVTVPPGDEHQGISIFNLNTQRGTVTTSNGKFNLEVGFNDSINVSSVQFHEFTIIIDNGIIASGQLNIQINEVVNFLPEVIVSPYDLTGNVTVDITRLEVATIRDTLTGANTQGLYFTADTLDVQSMPRNNALAMSETRLINGINFVNLFKEFLIASKRDQVERPDGNITSDVRALFNDEFFSENFDIEMSNIADFIYFADHNGLEEHMLQEGNELDLIEFLLEQSKKYKKDSKKNRF